MPSPFDRLKAQLHTTGLAQQNNALFQVISQLIDLLTKFQTEVLGSTSSPVVPGGTTTIINQTIQQLMLGDDSEGSGEIGPPGIAGIDGANGMVPYFIAAGETFTVPEFKQALFAEVIDNEGTLELDGHLIEVN